MDKLVKIEDVKNVIVNFNGNKTIPDFLVAHLYGVQTKEVNQAVRIIPINFLMVMF